MFSFIQSISILFSLATLHQISEQSQSTIGFASLFFVLLLLRYQLLYFLWAVFPHIFEQRLGVGVFEECDHYPTGASLYHFVEVGRDYLAHLLAEDWLPIFGVLGFHQLLLVLDQLLESKLEIRVPEHELNPVIDAVLLLNLPEQLIHGIRLVDATKLDPAGQDLGKQRVLRNIVQIELHLLFVEYLQWLDKYLEELHPPRQRLFL